MEGISEQDKKMIELEFDEIAEKVYNNPKWISNDTIIKMRLWEVNLESFTPQDKNEEDVIKEYNKFVTSYNGQWVKIWRILSAYYKPWNSF